MDDLVPALKRHPGLFVLLCALIFRVVHHLLRKLPVPKVVQQNEWRLWKWRNLSVSMVHSLLSGTWALSCALIWPETLHNLHSFQAPVSYLLVCVSTGYFVQDAADIILTGHARGSWEFLLHHVLVILSFLYTLYTEIYISGAVIALFVEVNSITLHLRLMLKLAESQSSITYQINKFVNLLTYVTFRLGTQFYLTWYIVKNYSWLNHGGYFLASIIMMNIMMLIYFHRLLRADLFLWKKSSARQNGTQNSKKFLTD